MGNTPVKLLIVDDSAIVRAGTQALLAEEADIEVIGVAESGQKAIELAAELAPDVILMDLVMPEMDGIEAISQITAAQPEIKILALSSFDADDKVFPAMQAGAIGYQLKDVDPDDLIRAIRQVDRGELSLDQKIARKVLQELNRPLRGSLTPDPLTARELEVLRLVAKGLNNHEIAERLVVTEVTVRTQVSHILGKLHLANRVQATLYALREGYVSLEDEEEN